MFSILENLQKNMVYSTYKMDAILKLVKALEIDNKLQKGVDNYFAQHDEDTEHIPEEKIDIGPDKDNIRDSENRD